MEQPRLRGNTVHRRPDAMLSRDWDRRCGPSVGDAIARVGDARMIAVAVVILHKVRHPAAAPAGAAEAATLEITNRV